MPATPGILFGKGATANVFEWNDNQVIKLYSKPNASELGEQELKAHAFAEKVNLPVPHLTGLTQWQKQPGLVMEKITGRPLWPYLNKHPLRLKKTARMLGRLQAGMHRIEANELPSLSARLKSLLEQFEPSGHPLQQEAHQLLQQQPEQLRLCHTDLNGSNILVTRSGKMYFIDWSTASAGPPLADLAFTLLKFFRSAQASKSWYEHQLLHLGQHLFLKHYLRAYRKTIPLGSQATWATLPNWITIVSAASFQQAAPGEHIRLRQLLRRYFL